MRATTHGLSTWTVDPTHVEVGFSVRHFMISTTRGRFGTVTGTVLFDEAHPQNSRIDVTVDVSSVDTRNTQRDDHLRSPDFFDVANHPTMRFVSKSIQGDIKRGEFRVIGDLTIRGVTKEVTLDVTGDGSVIKDPWGGERTGFSARGKINRSDFGLTWNVALEAGGVAVSDDVRIEIDVELVKQAEVAAGAA